MVRYIGRPLPRYFFTIFTLKFNNAYNKKSLLFIPIYTFQLRFALFIDENWYQYSTSYDLITWNSKFLNTANFPLSCTFLYNFVLGITYWTSQSVHKLCAYYILKIIKYLLHSFERYKLIIKYTHWNIASTNRINIIFILNRGSAIRSSRSNFVWPTWCTYNLYKNNYYDDESAYLCDDNGFCSFCLSKPVFLDTLQWTCKHILIHSGT